MNLLDRPRLGALLCGLSLAASVAAQGAAAAAPEGCLVAEFKNIGLGQHDVSTRARLASQWLQQHLHRCNSEQLAALRANSPQWLGTALSPEISGRIESVLEARESGNPRLLAQLYTSPLPAAAAAPVIQQRSPEPRAPVVQAVQAAPVLIGGVGVLGRALPAGPALAANGCR